MNKNHNSILMIFMCAALSFLIIQYDIKLVTGVIIILTSLSVMFVFPELGTWAVFFAIYANLPVIAVRYHNVPHLVAMAIPLLLGIPLASYIIVRHEKLIIDNVFLLMLAFLVVIISSSLFAKDMKIAAQWIITLVLEGLALYLLIINVVRNLATLRRVIWVLLLTGSLLGALSLYQELTHSYMNHFGGLALRGGDDETEMAKAGNQGNTSLPAQNDKCVCGTERAAGPLDGPNRYAQMMLVILPFGLFFFWGERSWVRRLSAAAAAILILSGVLLSYSRGACVTLGLMLLFLTYMRYIRPYQILLSAFAILLLIAVAAPRYLLRAESIGGAESLVSNNAAAQADAPIRGRITEMLAALHVFLDYPILGVGPGQYSPFYSIDYQLDPNIAFRFLPRTRRAHSLYFEMAAETGFIGLGIFLSMPLLVLYGLWQERRRWAHCRPDLANMAMAFVLCIVAYFGTALFLHFSYQRYYWLLLALAGATLQICRSATPPRVEPPADPMPSPPALLQVAMRSL